MSSATMDSPQRQGSPAKSLIKKFLWTTAGSLYLGGLYPWELEHDYLAIRRLAMPLRNLPESFRRARLVHISDLHCSPIVLECYLRRCIEAVNKLQPDFVAITGDLITGPKHYARRVADILKELSPRVASLACLGNHDYGMFRPGAEGASVELADYLSDELDRVNVRVLRNECETFERDGGEIQFAGLEDYWSRFDAEAAYAKASEDTATVTLCHNPDAAPELLAMARGWVLSGHTHGKPTPQGFDRLMPMTQRGLVAGHYNLGRERDLYINAGLGHAWRTTISDRPEITLFTMETQEPAAGNA